MINMLKTLRMKTAEWQRSEDIWHPDSMRTALSLALSMRVTYLLPDEKPGL